MIIGVTYVYGNSKYGIKIIDTEEWNYYFKSDTPEDAASDALLYLLEQERKQG